MFSSIPIRIFLIIFMIFVAYGGGDPFDIQWTKQSGGVCEEYSDGGVCMKGSNIKEVFSFELIFELPALIFIWGITIFGAWFKNGNLIAKLERASHLAKDAGELCAALGAIMVFTLPFNEEMINKAFGVVFLGYFWGHLTGIILITASNYLKTKEETIGPVQSSVTP